MGQVKRHGCSRSTHVQHGDCTLQFVMTCFVEEVADPDHASGFSCEVHCKSGRAAAEDASYRVQFLSTAAQVVASDDKIGGAEGSVCRKQNAILTVPESTMARRFGKGCGLARLHHRHRFHRGGLSKLRVNRSEEHTSELQSQ